jgi:hypothetical protein
MYISSDKFKPESNFIISKDSPVKYNEGKKIVLHRGIKQEEYGEVSAFYQKYNRMCTGNTTLVPESELKRYLALDNSSVLMRSPNGKLMGTIISLVLPIKNKSETAEEVILHGCTTFLAVHPAVRGHGLCMGLIRELINYGYEDGIYCDYHMVAFKIGNNSIPINSWFRPIKLSRSDELGFMYPGSNDPRSKTKNRLKYRCKLPLNHRIEMVESDNLSLSLTYYKDKVKNYKFVFWPDIEIWEKWVKSFPTYLIYNGENVVGITTVNTVYCVIETTGETGKILFPIICEGDMKSVMPCLCYIGLDLDYDLLYFYEHGSITPDALNKINAVKTSTKLWFSLYNNCIKIKPSDLHSPML